MSLITVVTEHLLFHSCVLIQLKHIFMVNCGGNLNILEILEPEEDVKFYIADRYIADRYIADRYTFSVLLEGCRLNTILFFKLQTKQCKLRLQKNNNYYDFHENLEYALWRTI